MSRRWMAVLLALAAVGALGLSSPTAAAEAPVPTHEVGDEAGFGATTDLGLLADDYLDLLKVADLLSDNLTFHQLEFTGTSDIWAVMEVVGETADAYSIQTDAVDGLKTHFLVDVTWNGFPEAGTYRGDMSMGVCLPPALDAFNTTTERVFAELRVDYLATSTDVSSWTVLDFALQGSETNTSFELRYTVDLRNFPSLDYDIEACEFTIVYETHELSIEADVDVDLETSYSPALDVFDFPIVDGENWSSASNSTQSGNIGGTLDVIGLDPEDEDAFFENLTHALEHLEVNVTGLSGFPIVLQDLTITVLGTPRLTEGVIHEFESPVHLSLQAEETNKTLEDGNLHTVYVIAQSFAGVPGPCGYVYSPDDGFIVGYTCTYGDFSFELQNVPADTARQRIEDTKQDYDVFSGAAPNPLAEFFARPPFFGVLMIGAIAVVVVALLMRRRRRPGILPPAPPPPGIPPGAPPPLRP
jgi:hypothetical protein